MDRRNKINYIRYNAATTFPGAVSEGRYACPYCGAGLEGENEGLITRDGVFFTCSNGCFRDADIYKIRSRCLSTDDFEKLFSDLCEHMGIPSDESGLSSTLVKVKNLPVSSGNDTEYFEKCHNNARGMQNLLGLSLKVIDRFKVGYDPCWHIPNALNDAETREKLLIPIKGRTYNVYDPIHGDMSKPYDSIFSVGQDTFFYATSDNPQDILFIMGDPLDAISMATIGMSAVAFNKRFTQSDFSDLIDDYPDADGYVLVEGVNIDSKDSEQAEDVLHEKMEPGITLSIPQLFIGQMYAHDVLIRDSKQLKNLAEVAKKMVEASPYTKRKQGLRVLCADSATKIIPSIRGIIDGRLRPRILSTGFPEFDEALGKGLSAGLYVVAAISSLGKTTFCLQIADQIAEGGGKALFYSLEQSVKELSMKSISRLTYEASGRKTGLTTLDLMYGQNYGERNQSEKTTIDAAVNRYEKYSKNLYIQEGLQGINADDIGNRIERYNDLGEHPVVIVDYLQIMKSGKSLSDKQSADKTVSDLKQISRKYDVPVIAISSINRENYTEPISLRALKESGSIEYSCDCLIGLQYDGMDFAENESKTDRETRIRQLIRDNEQALREGRSARIQAKILKNRNAPRSSAYFDYCAAYNHFREANAEEATMTY